MNKEDENQDFIEKELAIFWLDSIYSEVEKLYLIFKKHLDIKDGPYTYKTSDDVLANQLIQKRIDNNLSDILPPLIAYTSLRRHQKDSDEHLIILHKTYPVLAASFIGFDLIALIEIANLGTNELITIGCLLAIFLIAIPALLVGLQSTYSAWTRYKFRVRIRSLNKKKSERRRKSGNS